MRKGHITICLNVLQTRSYLQYLTYSLSPEPFEAPVVLHVLRRAHRALARLGIHPGMRRGIIAWSALVVALRPFFKRNTKKTPTVSVNLSKKTKYTSNCVNALLKTSETLVIRSNCRLACDNYSGPETSQSCKRNPNYSALRRLNCLNL